MNTPHPFPVEMPFQHEEMTRDFWRCPCTRGPDPAFHFRITLPSTWRPVDVPADPPTQAKPVADIAFFRTLNDPRAEIAVSAVLLSREIAPSDWLDDLLTASGHEILDGRDTDTAGGLLPDVLTRRVAAGEPVISRWLAIKNGKHVFVLEARTGEAHYAEFANAFFMAVASFELIHPGGWPLAESLKTFTRRDPDDFLMLFPESWDITEDASSHANALVVQLRNRVNTTTIGTITFAVVACAVEKDAQSLANNYVDELQHGGVPLHALTLAPAPVMEGFEAAWTASGRAEGTGGAAEVQIVVGKRPHAWFLIGLLGPARETAAHAWAVNTRAFQILLDNLKTSAPCS
jgi:hypothetical protein